MKLLKDDTKHAMKLKVVFIVSVFGVLAARAGASDFLGVTIVTAPQDLAGKSERIAPIVFAEEYEKRTKSKLKIQTEWPAEELPVLAIFSRQTLAKSPLQPGAEQLAELETLKPEGFLIHWGGKARKGPTYWVIGADDRGALFGTGKLLRSMSMTEEGGYFGLSRELVLSPAQSIRGHQLGYRNRANSWDAWTYDQFDQYIRDLVIFGSNCVENIPFDDTDPAPLMKYPRREMNKKFGEICDKYGIDHWVWTPVEFDLNDQTKRVAELARHEEFYKDTPRLDHVFFPGGDPGSNPANLVIPFLEDVAKLLARTHPTAKVWLSLQYFKAPDQQFVFDWLKEKQPDWFGGIVYGPSSPPIHKSWEELQKLGKKYRIRDYPDITHTVRCQFGVPRWDRVFALTLGRECINPRPVAYKRIHNLFAPYTDGFLTYSDGVHDDVNKIIYNCAGWDPDFDVREALIEYARYFIHPEIADKIADGILALESNWVGPVKSNGSIQTTFDYWTALEKNLSEQIKSNWRFQMLLFRAKYDAYQRHRLIYEEQLQSEADGILQEAKALGSKDTIERVTHFIKMADESPDDPSLIDEVAELGEALFASIQLQTSVEKYKASASERGCSIDFLKYPLNDRWYYGFRFPQILELKTEEERVAALLELARWKDPGAGGYYDDVGNIENSPHVITADNWSNDPEFNRHSTPEFAWTNNGYDKRRLSWQDVEECIGLHYEGLDSNASYRIKMSMGGGPISKLLANDQEATPLDDLPFPPSPQAGGKFGGATKIKQWKVPAGSFPDGVLELKWEGFKRGNYTFRPAMAEAWLIRE